MRILVPVALFFNIVNIMGDPGILSGLSRSGLNYCSKVLGTVCKREIEAGKTHFSNPFYLSVDGVEGYVTDLKVKNIRIPTPVTKTIPGKGILTSVSDVSFTYDAKVEKVKAKNMVYSDLRAFEVLVQKVNVTMITRFYNKHGRPELEILSCNATSGHIQPEFGRIAYQILFTDAVREYGRNIDAAICHQVQQTVNHFVSRKFKSLQLKTKVHNFMLDYSLDLNFATGQDSLKWFQKTNFESEIHPAGSLTDVRRIKLPLPRMFGVSCTDAVINNYLRVLYGDENLSFSEKVTVENLELAKFLGLQEVEENDVLEFKFNIHNIPIATITSTGILVRANGSVNISSKTSEVQMMFSCSANHNVGISSDFRKLVFQVKDVSLYLTNPDKPAFDFSNFKEVTELRKAVKLLQLKAELEIPMMTGLSLARASLQLNPPCITANSDLAVDDDFYY